jgi:glycosyltransferase involved in cell wall biosynthesis
MAASFLNKAVTAKEAHFNNDAPRVSGPRVSYILLAYNQEEYIREAVESALAQQYENLEIIISDDCSTDQTYKKIRETANLYKGNHKVLINRNSENLGRNGLANHINSITKLSTGELIVLAAGDDVSTPNRVQALVDLWIEKGTPVALLQSALKIISNDDRQSNTLINIASPERFSSASEYIRKGGVNALGASIACSRQLFSDFAELHPGIIFEDRVLAFRAYLMGEILHCEKPLVLYRRHSASITGVDILQNSEKLNFWLDKIELVYAQYTSDYLEFLRKKRLPLDHRVFTEIERAIIANNEGRHLLDGNLAPRLRALARLLSDADGPRRKLSLLAKIFHLDKTPLYLQLKSIIRFFSQIKK